uniref:uncharacterized protein n=1 Tax=Myxine glutinosa TaxID=7769 RepID=UPI00358F554B
MSEADVQKSSIDLPKALASGLLQRHSEKGLTFGHPALSDFLTARHAASSPGTPNNPISVLTAHLSSAETVLNSWRLLILTAGQGMEPAAAILKHIATTANSLPTTGNKNKADEYSVSLTRDLVFLALSAFEEAIRKVDDEEECDDKLQTAMKAVLSKHNLHLFQNDIISPPVSHQLLMLFRRARSVLPSLHTLQLHLGYGPLGEVKKCEEKEEKNDKRGAEADSADVEGAKEAEREKVENEKKKILEGSRVTSALSGCQTVKLNLGDSTCEAHLQLLAPELVERIHSVSISSAVGSLGPPLLAKMSSLEKIEVVGRQALSPFSEAEPLLLAVRQHPALSHITLTRLILGDTGLTDHLKALPTVNSLSLREMVLGPCGLECLLSDLSALSNLEELDLSGTRCSRRGIPDQTGEQNEDNMEVKGLNCLSKLQNLKTLNFSCCQLHTTQLASLVSSVSSLQKLKKLDLSWNSLAGVFSSLTQDLSHLPQMHCLILSGCQIHRSDIQALATVLPKMVNLDQLDLSENNLSGCFGMLVQHLTLCNLQTLGLENCQLTDADIAAFGQTITDSHLKWLRVLNVSGNPEVSPTAWKGFFNLLNQTGLPALFELNLALGHMRTTSSARGTQDDMFKALLKMSERISTLCHVNTHGWEVSPNVLSELQTTLANNSEESATVHSM